MPMAPKTVRSRGAMPARPRDMGSRSRPGGEWLHSTRWRKCRGLFLAVHPLCIDCEAAGRLMVATDVDHIIPHRGDYELFWDESNWAARCHACHSRKTCREDGGFGHGRRRGG